MERTTAATSTDPILEIQRRAKAAGVGRVVPPAPVRLGTLNAAVRRLRAMAERRSP